MVNTKQNKSEIKNLKIALQLRDKIIARLMKTITENKIKIDNDVVQAIHVLYYNEIQKEIEVNEQRDNNKSKNDKEDRFNKDD